MSGITLSKASSMTQLIIGANVSAMNLCEMKTFQAFNSTNAYVVCVFYVSCLLILWTLSKCYCVKCSRISQISGSYLLQGSAATHLRYDGQCFTKFVANFSENTTVKNCESILKIGQHKRMYGGTVFFWLTVYKSYTLLKMVRFLASLAYELSIGTNIGYLEWPWPA